MFYKMYRIFLVLGLGVNAGGIILRYWMPMQEFGIGFCEGCGIALLLSCVYFLARAREAGEPQADSRLYRWKRGMLQKLRSHGGAQQ